MPLRLRPHVDALSDGFYLVYDDDEGYAGRIYDGTPTSPPQCEAPWFWGLDFFKARSLRPYYGTASSLDDARAKFRQAWDARAKRDGDDE